MPNFVDWYFFLMLEYQKVSSDCSPQLTMNRVVVNGEDNDSETTRGKPRRREPETIADFKGPMVLTLALKKRCGRRRISSVATWTLPSTNM